MSLPTVRITRVFKYFCLVPSQTSRCRHCCLFVCPCVCLFVCYQSYEHNSLKTSELIVMQTGPQSNGIKRSIFGFRRSKLKSYQVKLWFRGIAEASFSTPWDWVVKLQQFISSCLYMIYKIGVNRKPNENGVILLLNNIPKEVYRNQYW